MTTRRLVVSALSFVLLAPGLAAGWGQHGHQIVARLADSRLSPVARAGVQQLLGQQTLADVANWADDIKNSRKETKDWHYTDIPITRDEYKPAIDCQETDQGDCSIAAIGREQAILADPHAHRTERTEALKFLVHLVGDLHQPLHSANNHDVGGNEETVRFITHSMKLHAVWDSGIIAETRLTDTKYVGRLNSWLASQDTDTMAQGTVEQWALDAHDQAKNRAYRDMDGALIADGEQLTRAYYEASRPVMEKQLAKAGVRLARVLNDAFAAEQHASRDAGTGHLASR
jgi:hypothetical protein